MKKIVFTFCFIVILFSCSSDDDSSTDNQNQTSINPPTWIQGTWLQPNPLGGFINNGYRFASDDFCLVTLGGQSCFKESITLTNNAGATTNVEEQITDNSYFIEITLGSQIVTYDFERISNTEIEWVNDPLGDSVQTIFIKQ